MPSKEIPLSQGKVTIVDEGDYAFLMQWKWHYHVTGYAQRNSPRNGGKQHPIKMHRVIMECPSNMVVDHINHDKLDNRRCNLRICTQGQNNINSLGWSRRLGKYKGTSWNKICKKWGAYIQVNRIPIFLGYYNNDIDAAKAYDTAAIMYHGQFAKLNFNREYKYAG